MEQTADPSTFRGHPAPKATWQAYLHDLRRAPGRAKAALLGCVIMMTLGPVGLSAMLPFITASFAAHTARPMSEAILLFVAIPLLITPLVLPITGGWVDRWGVRRVVIPAAILYAAMTALIPLSSTLPWLFGTVIVLTTMFGCMASLAVVFKVVTGWFPRHRGLGLALIGTVSSLVSALLSPVYQWVIDGDQSGFTGLGWDGTYYAVAAVIAILAIPAALFLFSEPPYTFTESAFPKPPTETNLKEVPGIALRKALRTRTWIFIVVALALAAAGPMAVRQNAVGFFAERGFDAATVAVSQSVLFIASIIGSLFGGLTLDRAHRPWVVAPLLAIVPIGLVLCYTNHGNVPLLFVATACLGFTTGAESSMGPFLIARYFGLKCFAQLQGLTLGIATLSLGLAPFLVSAMQTATGSYAAPFIVLTSLTGLAALLAFFLPQYPAEWTGPVEHPLPNQHGSRVLQKRSKPLNSLQRSPKRMEKV